MTSERRDDTIRACRCCFMCRYASPHFRASRLESRTPKGFAILLDAVDHGARAWTPELAAVFYPQTGRFADDQGRPPFRQRPTFERGERVRHLLDQCGRQSQVGTATHR